MIYNIYSRVSSEDQNVKQQAKYIREWANKNEMEIHKVVMDKESASLPLTQRKGFINLLMYCVNHKESLLIYNLDRLTRNWDDVTYIEKIFRDNWEHTQLVSISDTIDLATATGRFMFRIKMVTSCYMPEDMREKQRIGIERAKKEGKYKGGVKGRKWKNGN